MTEPLPEYVLDLMREEHEHNAATWADLTRDGVTETDPLILTAAFGSLVPADRDRLAAHLRDALGHPVLLEPAAAEDGEPYVRILAEMPMRTWNPSALDAWTDEMIETGWRHGPVGFEGCTIERVQAVTAWSVLMQHHRATNAPIWCELRAHGVTTDTRLALEAHFRAATEQDARTLAVHLRDALGYTTTVSRARRRLRREWVVDAIRPSGPTNPDAIDTWTDRMVQVVGGRRAVLDGWGTFIP